MSLQALSATGNLVLDPLYTLWYSLLNILPGVVLAILLLILGYCVAYLLGHGVKLAFEKLGLDTRIKRSELGKVVGHTHVSALSGEIVKWFIFLVFLQVAVDVLNLGGLSLLLDSFVRWLPHLLIAVLVFFFGLGFAYYVDLKIRQHTVMRGMNFCAALLKCVIIFLVLIIGLQQIGVNVDILKYAFLILLGALGLGVALALGIGLGLGMKKNAEKWIDTVQKHF